MSSAASSNSNLDDWAYTAAALISWCPRVSEAPPSIKDFAAKLTATDIQQLRRRRIDSLQYWVADPANSRQKLYNRLWHFQRASLERAIGALNEHRLEFLVFKGGEFISRYFQNQSIGMLYDVDILIRRQSVGAAKRALFGAGFKQAIFDPESSTFVDRDVSEVARMESAHYELAPFAFCQEMTLDADELELAAAYNEFPIWVTQDRRTFFVVEVDLHHAIAMDIEGAELFNRAVPSSYSNALTLSAADHVWFTTSRFYTEVALHGKRSLRDFCYLAAILRCETIDWDVIVETSDKYELNSALYYYLAFLDRILGGAVPVSLLQTLARKRATSLRDWGWMLSPLFGYSPPLQFPIDKSFRVSNAQA